MTEPSDEKLSALYRQAEQPEPSALLDRRIRDAARRAVAGRSVFIRLPSLALAATLVIGVGVAWVLIDIPPGEMPPVEVLSVEPGSPQAFDDAVREERASVAAPPTAPAAPIAAPKASVVAPGRRMEYQLEQGADRAAEPRETESLHDAMPTLMKRQAAAMAPAGQSVELDCTAAWLPQEATAAQWQAAIAQAREGGEHALAACLARRYRVLFETLPQE